MSLLRASVADIRRWRLCAQLLTGHGPKSPAEVVLWFGAIQAQHLGGALCSVALRAPTAELASVRNALSEGAVVRTWPMRGTLHLVPTADVRWMLGLTAKRMHAKARRIRASLGLDAAVLTAAVSAIEQVVAEGPAPRASCSEALRRAGHDTSGGRGYQFLSYAAMDGVVAFGPFDGSDQLVVLLDGWGPSQRKLERDQALAELAHRYLRSHGPATRNDLAAWTGLTLHDVDRAIAATGDATTVAICDDIELFVDTQLPDRAPSTMPDTAWLLPGYDEWLLGYRDRRHTIAEAYRGNLSPAGNGVFRGTALVRGRVIGTWQPDADRRQQPGHIEFFLEPSRTALRGIEAARKRWPDP